MICKRKRQREHRRRIKTKRGMKTITVNRGIKKFKKKVKIRKDERKILKFVSNPKRYSHKEFGGAIDFDLKGEVERIDLIPGSAFEVELPPDFEVQYHTHPDENESPPSPEDIISLLKNKNQQAEMIIRDGRTFVVIKTPFTQALSRLPTTELKKKLGEAFSLSTKAKSSEKDFKKRLEDMGFIVQTNNKVNTVVDVGIKPIEPKRKKKCP